MLEADTARAARTQLRAQALVPLNVSPVQRESRGLNTVIWESKVFSNTALTVWTRQLAGLVNAGLPIERALSAMPREHRMNCKRQQTKYLALGLARSNLAMLEKAHVPVSNIPLQPTVDLGNYQTVRLPYEWSEPAEAEVDDLDAIDFVALHGHLNGS